MILEGQENALQKSRPVNINIDLNPKPREYIEWPFKYPLHTETGSRFMDGVIVYSIFFEINLLMFFCQPDVWVDSPKFYTANVLCYKMCDLNLNGCVITILFYYST